MKAARTDLPGTLPADPMPVLAAWLGEAREAQLQPNPDAMVLATVDRGGSPSARVVLCKRCVVDPGFIVFGTDYGSPKARDLDGRPEAAAVFHWDRLGRQVRVEGPVTRSPASESDALFAARGVPSRVAVHALRQSASLDSRQSLEDAVRAAASRLGVDWTATGRLPEPASPIARPSDWGGFRLWPTRVELWVEGSGRLQDRALWRRTLEADDDGFRGGGWQVTRLAP